MEYHDINLLLKLSTLQLLRAQSRFVGTESRLESIFTGLDEILKYASADGVN